MFYIGIDGGGTKTKAAIMDENGGLLGVGTAGPSSVDTVTLDESLKNILEAIHETKVNLVAEEIISVFMGLGGIASKDDEERVINYFIEHSGLTNGNTKVVAKNDVYNALGSGLPQEDEGIIIIIGTGSVAFGIRNEVTHRSGGYGFKEGEPGSSYSLGKEVIGLIGKYMDGRAKESSLAVDVMNHLKIKSPSDLIRVSEELFNERTKTASLAVYVTKHAKLGDSYAIGIVDRATNELALMVSAVDESIRLKNKKLAVIGSLGNDDYFFNVFCSKIQLIDKNYEIFESRLDPVIGAALYALKESGKELSNARIEELKDFR
jgi:N-acetylglucosamine kinase-like BadF-type ATPase